jgi:hypothetical protein
MKKYLMLGVVLMLVLAAAGLPAMAQPPVQQVTTSAQITGLGGPPLVEAKWELSPNDDPLTPGIQIWPNHGPATTPVCVFAVVSDPHGVADITAAYADVYHPDGTFKLQIHMVVETDPVAIQNAIDAAYDTQQIDAAEKAYLEYLIEKHLGILWWGCFDYDVHQMAGVYSVEAWAVDQSGTQSAPLVNTFEVMPFVVLDIDFDNVDYGAILPTTDKWVGGDDVFSPGDGKPTVWNRGNADAKLRVHSSSMVGATYGKLIEQFDVELLLQQEVYYASQWVELAGPLVPCNPKQIDFSIHAPAGTPADTYSGVLDIEIDFAP